MAGWRRHDQNPPTPKISSLLAERERKGKIESLEGQSKLGIELEDFDFEFTNDGTLDFNGNMLLTLRAISVGTIGS